MDRLIRPAIREVLQWRQTVTVWMVSSMFAAKLLTQPWLMSDHAVMTLPPPRPSICLKARCLLCTPGLITLIISTILSIWMALGECVCVCVTECPIFARSLQQAVRQTAFRRRSWQRWWRQKEMCHQTLIKKCEPKQSRDVTLTECWKLYLLS